MKTTDHTPIVNSKDQHLTEGVVFLVNKPDHWTSFDVVAKMRTIFHFEKIGHAGSLDPLATGLLIVCTGKKTKEINQFVGLEKEYRATIRLGGRTPSFDSESEVIESRSFDDVTPDAVRETLQQFVGPQTQLPPMWSAAKVGGKRLYKYARKGRIAERKPREVLISSITPIEINIPEVTFVVVCSKGTYIRTLADDIGKKLGCGAYLTALERVRIGNYTLGEAYTIDQLMEYRRSLQSA
jgi:tRNA pseudouridine55 synthase